MDKNTLIVIPSRNRADWLYKCARHTLRAINYLKPEFWVRDDDPQLSTYEGYH